LKDTARRRRGSSEAAARRAQADRQSCPHNDRAITPAEEEGMESEIRVKASRYLVCVAVAAFALAGWGPRAMAGVKPGERITADNAAAVRDLVSPGVYYKVAHGMQLNIVPTTRVDWPPPYKDATEKYSSQVRLSKDHRTVVGYVAGQPFPLIDPNDPEVAEKIVWNNAFRPISTDDYDLRFYECSSQYVQKGTAASRQIDDTWVGHYAGYSLIGRTEVEPIPVDPDFKISGRYWLFGLYPVIAPASQRGAGIIRYRYADPTRGDDSWSYEVDSRRVRRINEAILSTATGVGAWNPDHYSGFNPKTEAYDYRFVGEKEMLACVHAKYVPERPCPTDGGSSVCPEDWEMRHMYVVEATPRYGVVNTLQGKNVLYLDSEVWFEPYIDTYDQRGELFQNYTYILTERDRPVPDAKVAIYPFKRSFVVAACALDVQGGISSQCYLPGRETPERETWYINMGAVDKDFFTANAMQEAAKSGH
jgi:Protein of unknown function (DUF1329)